MYANLEQVLAIDSYIWINYLRRYAVLSLAVCNSSLFHLLQPAVSFQL